MTSHLKFCFLYHSFLFSLSKGQIKKKKYVVIEPEVPSKNKRQPQKLSEAIELLRYLVLPLHLVSHDTKSNYLETISSPLIAVYLPNSHKSLICIHGSLCLYFLFLLYRIIFGIFELFQGIYLHV